MLPLEGTLLEKLRKIEALHAGTTVDGEREAARRAAERIRARIAEFAVLRAGRGAGLLTPGSVEAQAVRGAVSPLRAQAVPRTRSSVQHGASAGAARRPPYVRTGYRETLR